MPSARCPYVHVVALTSFHEEELVQAAFEAGAISYLLKNVSLDELAASIRVAHAGRPEAVAYALQHHLVALPGVIVSTLCLFPIGAGVTLRTGRSVLFSGMR